jgi:hypothetical protein
MSYQEKNVPETNTWNPLGAYPNSAPDPWRHRSIGMKCSSCMWFVLKEVEREQAVRVDAIGRCRRHAPTHDGYPAVFQSDWCGDHKLDQNKI